MDHCNIKSSSLTPPPPIEAVSRRMEKHGRRWGPQVGFPTSRCGKRECALLRHRTVLFVRPPREHPPTPLSRRLILPPLRHRPRTRVVRRPWCCWGPMACAFHVCILAINRLPIFYAMNVASGFVFSRNRHRVFRFAHHWHLDFLLQREGETCQRRF